MGAVNAVIAMVARSRSGPVTYSTPLTDWEYEHMLARGRAENDERRAAEKRWVDQYERSSMVERCAMTMPLGHLALPGDLTRIEMWECSHCGNVFVSRPTSCPGCAGREFR